MTSRNQKVWVNTIESWHLHETTVHLQLLFHFSFALPQCPAERDFGECSLTNCREGSQCLEKQILRRSGQLEKLHYKTLQSDIRGKRSGKAEEAEKPEPTQGLCTRDAEDWGIWAEAPFCPNRLKKPFLFPKYSKYWTISWVGEMQFWEYLFTCAKNLTLTFSVLKKKR